MDLAQSTTDLKKNQEVPFKVYIKGLIIRFIDIKSAFNELSSIFFSFRSDVKNDIDILEINLRNINYFIVILYFNI